MSATTRAKRPAPVEAAARWEAVRVILSYAGLEDVEPEDVLSVHLGVRSIGIRRKVRGRTGKVVPGHVLATSHNILPEPLED